MFDVSGLTEVKMRKRNGRQGSYYVDSNDICIAKTCSRCHEVLPRASFDTVTKGKYKVGSSCYPCLATSARDKRNSIVDGEKLGTVIARSRSDKLKKRTDAQVVEDRNRLHPLGVRPCTLCERVLPFSEFFRDRTAPSGIHPKCKSCNMILLNKYRKSTNECGLTNEQIITRKYHRKLLSRSDAEIALDAAVSVPSGEKPCDKCKALKPLNEFHISRRKLDGHSRDCKVCTNTRSRAKRLQNRNVFEAYWAYKNIPSVCYICGGPWDHVDHVIPEALGGPDDLYNRLPMCEFHNISKWKHPLRDWLMKNHPDKYDEVIHRVTVEYGMEIDPTPLAH